MIQLTDREGRLITLTIFYEAPADNREAEQNILKILQAAPSDLFNVAPTIVPMILPR